MDTMYFNTIYSAQIINNNFLRVAAKTYKQEQKINLIIMR